MGNKSSKTNVINSNYIPDSQKNDADVEENKSLHNGAILSLNRCNEIQFSAAGDDNAISLFDYESLPRPNVRNVMYLRGHSKAVNKTVGGKGNTIWSCSRDLTIRKWNLVTGECEAKVEEAHSLNISAVALSPDGNTLASGSRDYTVKIWDLNNDFKALQTYKVPRNIVTSLIFHSTGNILYQGSEDLCVRGWDVRAPARAPAVHLTGLVYFPVCMDLSPDDGHFLATGCKGFDAVGPDVKIWDLRQQRVVHSLQGHTHDVRSCHFIRGASRILSVSKDGSTGLWDIPTGKKIAWNVSQKVQYTSCTLGNVDDNKINFIISAFDGSLTFACIDESEAVDGVCNVHIEYATPPSPSSYDLTGDDR